MLTDDTSNAPQKRPRRAATGIPRHPFTRPLTLAEFGAYLTVSERTVRRLVAHGDLKAIRVSPRILRITPEQADEFLQGLVLKPFTPPW